MIVFLAILLLIIFSGIRFSTANEFNTDYLDKRQTTTVNGIFVILIIFSHYVQYADTTGAYDLPYMVFREHISQMVVASFLFYSGYGMMECVRKQGSGYVRKVLSKFWQLLFRTDCAVLLFMIAGIALGRQFQVKELVLAFATWGSIGNSNWYIFDILVLYLLFYLSFRIGSLVSKDSGKHYVSIVLLIILTALFVMLMIRIDRPSRYWNTVLLLPLGCLYSECRPRIDSLVMKNDFTYSLILMLMGGAYIVFFFRRESPAMYICWSAAFTALMLLFTMKASICSGILEWFGKHVFSIYILQRIPMMVLRYFGYTENHKYISLVVVFLITIPMALAFEAVTDRIIALISGKSTVRSQGVVSK